MRVLHILSSSHFSGAENVVCQIIKMFDEEMEMAYVSPDGSIRKALEDRNIFFFPIKKFSHKEIDQVVKEYKPDVIHGHDIRGAYEASKYGKNCRIIHTIHGNDIRMRKISLKSMIYLQASRNAAHIFWVSKSCLDQFQFKEKIEKKSSVLVNVIDEKIAKEKGKEEAESFDALYIGRLCYPKNPSRFVEVIRNIKESYPSIKAAMLGTGEDESILKEKISTYGLEENISLLGFQNNPQKYLSKTKVLLLTSDWEGTPMVSLEAMALGIPMVSTPTDGMCDVIVEGENGFLSKDEKELASRTVTLLSDELLWKRMSEAQIKRGEEINNLEKYKAKLREAYKTL